MSLQVSICICTFLQDGFLSAVPYLVGWITSILSGILADYLRERGILRTVTVRKLWMIIGDDRIMSDVRKVKYSKRLEFKYLLNSNVISVQ